MSINYLSYVTRLYTLMGEHRDDFPFPAAIPATIDYAEQRIYRELDLLVTRITDATTSLTAGSRTTHVSTALGDFLVLEQINIFTPSSATSVTGSRVPLVNVSRDFLDITYPSAATANRDTPEFWTMMDNNDIILGPVPDSSYAIEFVGTQRPAALSASNSSTFLTFVLPDLFVAASMIFLCSYLEGATPQDGLPTMQYWEGQYKTLMQSALMEEARKKYQSQGWTHAQPSPVATPPRV